MVMGNPSRTYTRKVELYHISYDSELTKKEHNNALLDFVRNKYFRANADENLSAKEIVEKHKK